MDDKTNMPKELKNKKSGPKKLVCSLCGEEMLEYPTELGQRFAVASDKIKMCVDCFVELALDNNAKYLNLVEINPAAAEELEEQEEQFIDLLDIIAKVKAVIKGQDEQVEEICTAICNNQVLDDEEVKSNILLLGPTGNGKTAIAKLIAKLLNIPYVDEISTRYSETGYQGACVEDILINLINASGGDIQLAERGIIIIDEIDKKRPSKGDQLDVSGEPVLDSLLKLVEGTKVPIVYNNKQEYIDTTRITMVFVGAFPDLVKIREDRLKGKGKMGFSNEKNEEWIDPEYTVNDFEKFGFKPEIIGRFDVIVEINKLKVEDYEDIILNSEKSVFLSYLRLIKENGIEVKYNSDVISEIAILTEKMDIGARGIKKVVHKMFKKILFISIIERDKYKVCNITKKTLTNPSEFVMN